MLEALIAELASIEDPRCGWKVEHRLIDILVIAVCAVLGEAGAFEDIALYGRGKEGGVRGFLALPDGIPSHDTFRRVFTVIDPEAFERSFPGWVRAVFRPEEAAPRQVAIDGKTVRRSFDRKKGRSPLHLVGAYATEGGLVLAQRAAESKGRREQGRRAGRHPGPAGRAGPARLPGEPRRARLPAHDRRADHGSRRGLPADPQGQPPEGPRRGEGLVRGQRPRARRGAPPPPPPGRRPPPAAGAPAPPRPPRPGRLPHPPGP